MFSEELQERLNEMKEINALYKEVIEDLIDYDEDIPFDDNTMSDKDLYDKLTDISSHGCVSGAVPSMINYEDTVKFYERHKYIINEYLSELWQNTGCESIKEIFRDFDDDDLLCLDVHNQNLLAWFGFEYVNSDIVTMMEEI